MVFQAWGKAFQLSDHAPEASLETNQAWTVANEPFRHRTQSRFVLPQASIALPQASNALPQVSNALPQASNALPQVSNFLPQASNALPQVSSALPQASNALPQVSPALAVVSCCTAEDRRYHLRVDADGRLVAAHHGVAPAGPATLRA
jgi:hypothetical protein